jgi:hypothetical protein
MFRQIPKFKTKPLPLGRGLSTRVGANKNIPIFHDKL